MSNRWLIAAGGVLMQLALGAVYAWSVFRKPLSEEFGASVSAVNTAFTLTLAIVPGYSHYNFGQGPDIARVIEGYLDEPTSKATQFAP